LIVLGAALDERPNLAQDARVNQTSGSGQERRDVHNTLRMRRFTVANNSVRVAIDIQNGPGLRPVESGSNRDVHQQVYATDVGVIGKMGPEQSPADTMRATPLPRQLTKFVCLARPWEECGPGRTGGPGAFGERDREGMAAPPGVATRIDQRAGRRAQLETAPLDQFSRIGLVEQAGDNAGDGVDEIEVNAASSALRGCEPIGVPAYCPLGSL